jgi:hypothetical protein
MRTKTTLMFMILLVLVLSGVVVYGVERIKSENETASSLLSQSAEVDGANAIALATKKDKSDAATNLALLDQIELGQSEFVPFLETIESTGRTLGVKVKISAVNADPAPKVTATSKTLTYIPPQAVHLSISGSGSWAATLGFVHALENLPHKISLDAVTLTYSPGDVTQGGKSAASSGNWQSSITLTTAIYVN